MGAKSIWPTYPKNYSFHLNVHSLGFHSKTSTEPHMKVLLNSFPLNGQTLGFHPQTQKVQPHLLTQEFDSGSERVNYRLNFYRLVCSWASPPPRVSLVEQSSSSATVYPLLKTDVKHIMVHRLIMMTEGSTANIKAKWLSLVRTSLYSILRASPNSKRRLIK